MIPESTLQPYAAQTVIFFSTEVLHPAKITAYNYLQSYATIRHYSAASVPCA